MKKYAWIKKMIERCLGAMHKYFCQYKLQLMHAKSTQKMYVNVNILYELIGHPSEAMMRKTAKEMNII